MEKTVCLVFFFFKLCSRWSLHLKLRLQMLEKAKCGKNEESLHGKVEKIFLHAVWLDLHSSAGGVGWCGLV